MKSGAETVQLGAKNNGISGRRLILAAVLALLAIAVGLVGLASGRTFTWGTNVVVGPKYSGPVSVSPGCVATAREGQVTLPYRASGPNQLTSVLGWVFIPRG